MPANHNVPHTAEAKAKMSAARLGKPLLKKRREIRTIDGIEYFHCGSCGEFLRREGFYADKRTQMGIKYQCKSCHNKMSIAGRDADRARDANREYMARAREKRPEVFREREKEYSRNRPTDERRMARDALNRAVRRGEVLKPKHCQYCSNETRLNAHHEDYSKPLDVVWLCSRCHGKVHRNN